MGARMIPKSAMRTIPEKRAYAEENILADTVVRLWP
jgi:hypothetical protein